jgi:WD40 repeat protein
MIPDDGLALTGHREDVETVAFGPDRKTIYSGGGDCTIMIWDPRTGKVLASMDPPEGRYPGVAASGGTIYDDIEGIRPPFIHSLSGSKDGKGLVIGASDQSIRVWDIAAKKQRLKIALEYCDPKFKIANAVRGVAFAPDGKSIASGSDDKVVRLWASDTGKLIREFRGHEKFIYGVAFAPDGKSLASCSGDATIRVWDVDNDKAKMILKPSSRVNSVAISADGRYLASGGRTEDAKAELLLWDFKTGKQLAKLDGHRGYVCSVAFSPDSTMLASVGSQANVILWNVAERKQLVNLEGHKDTVTSVAFSPDGKLLATGSSDRTVRVWNVEKYLGKK